MRKLGSLVAILVLSGPVTDLCAQVSALPEEVRTGLASPDEATVEAAVARLLETAEELRPAVVAALGVDHLRSRIRIEALLDQLADPRFTKREEAEAALVALGGEGLESIRDRARQGETLEERLRAGRVLATLSARDAQGLERKARILAGLARAAREMAPGEDLRDALVAAARHPDASVAIESIRSLGRHAGPESLPLILDWLRPAGPTPRRRAAALAALADSAAMLAAFVDQELNRTLDAEDRLRLYRGTRDPALRARLSVDDPRLRAIAEAIGNPSVGDSEPPVGSPCRVLRATGAAVEGRFVGVLGDELLLRPLEGDRAPLRRIHFDERPTCLFADEEGESADERPVSVFLRQGSLLRVQAASVVDGELLVTGSLFGDRTLPLDSVQAISFRNGDERAAVTALGVDVLRLVDGSTIRGRLEGIGDGECRFVLESGDLRRDPLDAVEAILFERRVAREPVDLERTRVDLVRGDRLFAILGHADSSRVGLYVDGLGALSVAESELSRLEFEVRSGAVFGFTLVANYSQDEVLEIDMRGRRRFVLEDVYAVWDVESLPSGNLLITETSSNRVIEVDRESGEVVWSFEALHHPYDADRLANGNTLIADSLNTRVLEVSPIGEVVWEATGYSATDVERLPDGRTLISDDADRRVVEIEPDGRVVWQIEGLTAIRDADRLPNGNTLVTLYSVGEVVEFDPTGRRVFVLEGLSAPCDADRLPNGNTIVAESGQIREFDRQGNEVWRAPVEWAAEVNRY